jgi:hypothetical protein
MTVRSARVVAVLLLAVTAQGCESAKSANPLSPSVAGPIPGVEISAPKPLEPGANWEISNDKQPLQLLIENPGSNGQRPVTIEVEVASDEGFTTKVYTKAGIEQGPNGRTELRLPSKLTSDRTYFWRAMGQDGAHTGPWSPTQHFQTPEPPAVPPPGGGGGGGVGAGPAGNCATDDGDYLVNCIAQKYPSYRRAGVSSGQRRSNMEFLRDRIIEAGLCGGLDLGWNLKRGGPEISIDFLAERRGGAVLGHDIAFDYDNTSKELQLYWGGGTFPYYKKYTRSYSCK